MTRAGITVWLCALAVLGGCEREQRPFTTPVKAPAAGAPESPRAGALQPATAQQGGIKLSAASQGPYENNAWAVNQGKRATRQAKRDRRQDVQKATQTQ